MKAVTCALLVGMLLCGTTIHAGETSESPAAPEIFAPGVISGQAGVDSAAFAPDGNTVYFDRSTGQNQMILVSHKVNGAWSTPQIAPFSGQWLDHDPAMSPDGSFLVFTSNRPDTPDGKALDAVRPDGTISAGWGGHLWRVDRKGDGWGVPVRLPDTVNSSTRTYSPSIAADGSVYFQRPDTRPGATAEFHLYRSAYRHGSYLAPVALKLGTPDSHELDPAIAPDESFIVFDANYADKQGPDHLYIAFREGDHWSTPIDLGNQVNRGGPWGAHLGPDHRSLYFSSARTGKVTYPRTHEQAELDRARMESWDNGNDHLWSISLAPWLDAHR
ncbi:TolB family protein [Dyella tabacisoli]|uniref:WD40 repeat protein n=1 Tax=Dyella tabacisoli TaxID=2282381 RepID=A0A369UTI7_9GAMM|nr:PD40 domain-containing protein [Dyella tabacisoli]RDD83365.1 hypothetical protein DVJ77_01915 [Dyella tabacisoli]